MAILFIWKRRNAKIIPTPVKKKNTVEPRYKEVGYNKTLL